MSSLSVIQQDKYRFVRLVFWDHCSTEKIEWMHLSDYEALEPKKVGIGGWLIDDQPEFITLGMALDEDAVVCGRFTILKSCIIGEIVDV